MRFFLQIGFQESSTPSPSGDEQQYFPEADNSFLSDADGIQSVASDEQQSDFSDNEDIKMPPTPKGSTKKSAVVAKTRTSFADKVVRSGDDMTTVIPYGHGFGQFLLIIRVVRSPDPETTLIADGGALRIDEQWPEMLFSKDLLTQKKLVRVAPELKVSSDALVSSHCNEIATIKPNPQKPTVDSAVITLPFLCKPVSDRSPYVERKNGLYVFHVNKHNIMFVFLKDMSASYQKEKKKKTKATTIDLGSLGIDSDDSDDDSDYDPFGDAEQHREEFIRIFGNNQDAERAIIGLNAGGEEATKWRKIIFHMKVVNAEFHKGTNATETKMDVEEEEEEDY